MDPPCRRKSRVSWDRARQDLEPRSTPLSLFYLVTPPRSVVLGLSPFYK